MPPVLKLTSIKPPHDILESARSIKRTEASLNAFATAVSREMKKYPPKINTNYSSYKRTGNLSRSWRSERGLGFSGFYMISVFNDAVGTTKSTRRGKRRTGGGQPYFYARDVQGTHADQTPEFRFRGWSSIEDVVAREWDKALPEIQNGFAVSFK